MAEIRKLTNKTRTLLRAPLRPKIPVSAVLLAELLPVVKKAAAARKKRSSETRASTPIPSNGRSQQPVRSTPTAPERAHLPSNGKPAGNGANFTRPVNNNPGEKPKQEPDSTENPAVPPPGKPSSLFDKSTPTYTSPRNPQSNGSDLRFPRPGQSSAGQRPDLAAKFGEIKPTETKPAEKKPADEKPSVGQPPAEQRSIEKPDVNPAAPPANPLNGKLAANGNGKTGSNLPPSPVHGPGTNGYNHRSPLFRSDTPPNARFEHPAQRGASRPGGPLSQPPLEIPQPPVNGSQHGHPNGGLNGNGKAQSSGAQAAAAGAGKSAPRSQDLLTALDDLFQAQPDLPNQAALLGVGEDGFPVLLDLNDPNPGALVVIGDERQAQLDMLRSAVASIIKRNNARSVQILVISCEPKVWQQWISNNRFNRYFIGVEGVEDLDVLSEWTIRLGDWTEQRRLGERSGPPVILVLDTLSFLPRLDFDIRQNFEWMAKEGPAAQIWPLAAISTDLALSLNSRRLLRSFRTRVLGYSDDASFYQKLNGMSEQDAKEFGEPGVFAVQLGEDWLRFRLPGR